MSFPLSSPVTGSAQTGFTTPSFTIAADNNPANNGKQWIVTAASGASGITAHTAADPFTIAVFKPLSYKVAQFVSTTIFKKPPRNIYKVVVRKGVIINSNFPKDIAIATLAVEVPAGAELLDAVNLRAMMSAMLGALTQQSSGFGDTVIQNSI